MRPISAFSPIGAESFSSQSGLETEGCSDSGGGLNIGYIQNGDYAVYAGVDFGSAELMNVNWFKFL